MISVVDELLEDIEPKYEILDSDTEEVLYTGILIRLISNVTQAGTPLGKALFDSIKGDVYRVDRYSKPTFTQDVSLVNTSKTGAYIALWGNSHYTKYGITVSASSENSTDYAYKAMNGVEGYWSGSSAPTVATPLLFTIQLDRAIMLKKYKISGYSSSLYCKDFTLQGSNDGENYIDIQTVTGNTYSETEYTANNTEFYKYYRLSITASANSSALAAILEFNITSWEEKTYFNKIALDDIPLTSYVDSQRLMIDLTDEPDTQFTSNILPPFMATSQGGYLIQSSGDYLGTSVIDAFDYDDTYTAWRSLETQTDRYIKIQLPKNIIANRFSFKATNISNGVIRGSNDGDNWTTLVDSIATDDGTTAKSFAIDVVNTQKYRYYRFDFNAYTANTSSYIYSFGITVGYASVFNYNDGSYININSIGNIPISSEDSIIDDGNYELVYDGTNYLFRAYFNSFSRDIIENAFTHEEKVKLAGIEVGAEVNIIDGFKLNGTEILPDANRVVSFNNVEMTTNRETSVSSSNSKYPTSGAVKSYVDTAISGVTITMDDYPTQNSDNAVKSGGLYEVIGNVESLLSAI